MEWVKGVRAHPEFNVYSYRARYADLDAAFGDDLASYYTHYIEYGKAEGRNGAPEEEHVVIFKKNGEVVRRQR